MTALPSEEFDALHVCVPEGAPPGTKIAVTAPDGRNFELTVPPNTRAGDLIEVHMLRERDRVAVSPPVSGGAPVLGGAPSGARTAMAAGVAAVCVGTLIIGPVTGLACAGAAVYATTRGDAIGDAARAVGVASLAAYSKASEVNTKYGIFDRLKEAASKTAAKASEINAEYHLSDRAAAAAATGVAKVRELDERHQISSTIGSSVTAGITKGAQAVTTAMLTHPRP